MDHNMITDCCNRIRLSRAWTIAICFRFGPSVGGEIQAAKQIVLVSDCVACDQTSSFSFCDTGKKEQFRLTMMTPALQAASWWWSSADDRKPTKNTGSWTQGESLICFVGQWFLTAEYIDKVFKQYIGVEYRVPGNVAGGFHPSPLESLDVEGEDGVKGKKRSVASFTTPYDYFTTDRMGDKSIPNWPLSRWCPMFLGNWLQGTRMLTADLTWNIVRKVGDSEKSSLRIMALSLIILQGWKNGAWQSLKRITSTTQFAGSYLWVISDLAEEQESC